MMRLNLLLSITSLLMFLLVFTLLALSTIHAPVLAKNQPATETKSTDLPTMIADTPSIGNIDLPGNIIIGDPHSSIEGWALDMDGVATVKLRIDGNKEINIGSGITRKDVEKIYPNYPNPIKSGFVWRNDLSNDLSAHSQVDIVVVDNNANETVLGTRYFVMPEKMNQWQGLFARNPHWANDPFYILHATSGISNGGANGISNLYRTFESPTMRIGIRVPILYMRTTLGKNNDWQFDPEFDTRKTVNKKRLADDSLQTLMDFAISEKLAVLFTLNGGVWADAFGTAADWDLNDHLEEDPINCQWSQYDEVFADDYLKGLSGSTESPELARVLTLNHFANDINRYKKRNLQNAGKLVSNFQHQHPTLFAGINLDADTYANPFFKDRWHDYNPNTIRQFRQWLQGNGIYAPGAALASYRRTNRLDLKQVNALAKANYHSWNEVDPPREKPAKGNPQKPGRLKQWWLKVKNRFVNTRQHKQLSLEEIAKLEVPWIREWEIFRRHLIDVHYDDLSVWLTEVGIKADDIYSSQGFSAPQNISLPFAVYLDSPVKNYDSGGMSVEGAVPRNGHLGVIVYGKSAANNIRMETQGSLFETFFKADPDWGIVEYNTSDFKKPGFLADYGQAYRSLRDTYNYQARFISAMAWNGSNGTLAESPGFAAHTALRNTPMELAIKDFMVSRAFLPRNTLMWEFGSPRHLDLDGWIASTGLIQPLYGSILVNAVNHQATLISPALVSIEKRHNLLVLGITDQVTIKQIEVFSQSNQHSISGPLLVSNLHKTNAGIEIPLDWRNSEPQQGLKIVINLRSETKQFELNHVVLLPNAVVGKANLTGT